MTRDRDSGAGWSEPGDSSTSALTVVPATSRYQELEVAGRGGMGEVVVAHDRRLGRRVALKRVAGGMHQRADARLVREAWVTARLEHPAIVPVYDTDVDARGALFYTMRLVDGRTLADAIAEATTRAARLGLLRHFLAAAQAVAFAHSHGIVHRDLKPANILVGAFGETQVADWGLAGFVDREVAVAFDLDVPSATAGDGDTTTRHAGTPAYMSPEQERGELTDRGADVWALGAILHEIVTGTRLRLEGGRLDRGALHAAGIPADLRAIVEHATAAEPRDRYRDASELVADVMRYLDGRRVAAHDYSTLELAQRLARRLRVPLLLAATALVVGTVVLAGAVRRITAERERALAAEAATAGALEASRRTSAGSLSGQAVTAIASGAVAETEVLAASALALTDSPDARGALAAARASTAPLVAEAFALGACERVVPLTWDLALCHGTSEIAAWSLGAPTTMRWSRDLAARQLVVSSGGQLALTEGADVLHVLDLARGDERFSLELVVTTGFTRLMAATPRGNLIATSEGRTLNVVSIDERRVLFTRGSTCEHAEVGALTGHGDEVIAVCTDGTILRVDARAGTIAVAARVPALADVLPATASISPDGRWLVVGGVQGDVMRADLASGEVRRGPSRLVGSVRDVGFVVAPDVVIVAGDNGPGRVWDLASGAEVLRLPARIGVDPRLTGDGIVTGGRRAARWRLPPYLRPRVLDVGVGIAALAIDPAGRFLAIARSDGLLEVRDRDSGLIARTERIGTQVVKTLDFSSDGARLALSISDHRVPPLVFQVPAWTSRALATTRLGSARRLIFDGASQLLAIYYAPPLSVWAGDEHREIASAEMVDAATDLERREVVLLAIDGTVLRWRSDRLEAVGALPGATLIATAPRAGRIVGGHDTGVSIRERDGHVSWIPSPQARLTALAVSPDERHVLGGRSDGTIAVWTSDGTLRAELRGHRHRVATLVFAPDGLLYSAGWDGRILTWDLSVLDADGHTLVPRATAGWALDLPLVLGDH